MSVSDFLNDTQLGYVEKEAAKHAAKGLPIWKFVLRVIEEVRYSRKEIERLKKGACAKCGGVLR